jgi:hypothetical protein
MDIGNASLGSLFGTERGSDMTNMVFVVGEVEGGSKDLGVNSAVLEMDGEIWNEMGCGMGVDWKCR